MNDPIKNLAELEEIENLQIKSHLLQLSKLEEQKKKVKENLMSQCGLNPGDKLTLKLYEYRDDRVKCHQVAQEVEVYVSRVYVQRVLDENNEWSYKNAFICPVLHKPSRKKGQYNKKPIFFNQFLHWELYKEGKLVLRRQSEQVILPDTYKDDEYPLIRERLKKAQKI